MAGHSEWRDVHFHDASTGETFGGFYQGGALTESSFLSILENMLLVTERPWTVKHRESDRLITASQNPVVIGNYDVYSDGLITVSDEPWFVRLISYAISGREDAFRDGVRARDGKCVITGEPNAMAPYNRWDGYKSAHVFPLHLENLWVQFDYGRWITNMDGETGTSKINSIQNGLLMAADMHLRFDQYLIGINPDDNYKIITFCPNSWGIDGRPLDPICRDPNDLNSVSDELLRWHFRQCVFANMRGAGEPLFETDFPPGEDMMATLCAEPYGKERFEMELAWRLKDRAGEAETLA